ncbi:MAG: HNH endonuclease signature motif containing protein [Leptolyngbyaceae cyanobacterium bins.302]|nr:HNH endonuclease signature motif containing protein [Leptolyngbyaceae cyanobacterium bins.302]
MASERVSAELRRLVAARAQGYCEYCYSPEDFATESFTIEHIKPRVAGGETVLDNLAWSCVGCNSYKQARMQAIDPETGQLEPLFHPRISAWSEHFAWSDDSTLILGKTACGRATIQALRMNRSGIVNLRRLLVMGGLHPPQALEGIE